jgi:hypothetical protein
MANAPNTMIGQIGQKLPCRPLAAQIAIRKREKTM